MNTKKNDDVKVIFNINIANELLERGFNIVKIEHAKKSNGIVHIFKDKNGVESYLKQRGKRSMTA